MLIIEPHVYISVDPTGKDQNLPLTAAVVREDEPWGTAGTMAVMTMQY
jgi:hypothetical protein